MKDFGILYLQPLLKNIRQNNAIHIQRLDLHYLESSPGVALSDIDYLCPLLEKLTICDSLVTWFNSDNDFSFLSKAHQYNRKSGLSHLHCQKHINQFCSRYEHFHNLKECKLYRVEYKEAADWEVILRLPINLRSLHLESSRSMNDSTMQGILSENSLSELEVTQKLVLLTVA